MPMTVNRLLSCTQHHKSYMYCELNCGWLQPVVKVVLGPEVPSQDAVSLDGRDESVVVCQLLNASLRHQVQLVGLHMACAVKVLVFGVQTLLTAVVFAAVADQIDSDFALMVSCHHVV